MNNTENIIQLIDFWKKAAASGHLFSRSVESDINLRQDKLIAIIGPRRSGKSSLLKLIMKKLPEDSWLYVNFEDPFFIEHNEVEVIEKIINSYLENFSSKLKYLFFDEIQNINKWEKAIRKFEEAGTYKIFITGSSSKLLSREFSTVLTGRHKTIKILPLDFQEFLNFRKFEFKKKADYFIDEEKIKKIFREYLLIGGFPRVVLDKRPEILKQYFYDILQKDIVSRYEIRQQEKLERLGVYLLTNAARIYSVSSLGKTFDLSWEYISQYIQYFKDAFVMDDIKQFSYSLKTQAKAFNKIFAVDNGLITAVSFKFSENLGTALENCAFNYFASHFNEVYYYKTKSNSEVDFVLKNGQKIEALIQVCFDIEMPETRRKETKVLLEAGKELCCQKLIMATLGYHAEESIGDQKIRYLPLHRILLGMNRI